jgi:hypothetical protein
MKNAETITQNWIRANGMQVSTFNTTPVKLLQAQQTAHTLLTQCSNLLTSNQTKTLKAFQRKMADKRTRAALKPEAAYSILNINTKINRQLFKLNKQL